MPILSVNGTNFTVSESFENFTTADALNGYRSTSDNGTLFTAGLISSTDHTDAVTENFTSLPPSSKAVPANDSTAIEPTVNPFTIVYNDSIHIKNFSFIGKKLCVEWSVHQRILGDVRSCLLSYAQGDGKPMNRKYITCPRSSEACENCFSIKAAVVTRFCIQVTNRADKVFNEQCVYDNETLFSLPQTSSTDHIAVVNTSSSIIVGSSSIQSSESTTSTPLGATNITDNIPSFTISDNSSSETSLLTQTSLPEMTSGITNLTSEFTQFLSSSSGFASTTKALSVSGVNETSTLKEDDLNNTTSAELSSPNTTESILYKHSTASSDNAASPESNSSESTTNTEIIPSSHSVSTPDSLNFSSLPPSTTVEQSNDSTASEQTVDPLSSTTVHDHPIDIKKNSLIDKKLCVEWSVNQQVLGDMLHCLLSYALGNKERIACPSLSNRISEECLFIQAAVINELCIQIMNRSNKVLAEHCVHEHYIDHSPVASSSSPVSGEQIAFNITHLSVLKEGDSFIVKWAVNREEPFSCSLKLNIESNNSVTEEKDFKCMSNSYLINSTEDNVMYEICLTSYHSDYDSVTVCRDYYHMTKGTADAVAAVKSAQYYSYAVLIGLLVLVICFISLLLIRALVQKKSASDAYNVFRAEKHISIRKQSEHQTGNQNTSRYSYTSGEAV